MRREFTWTSRQQEPRSSAAPAEPVDLSVVRARAAQQALLDEWSGLAGPALLVDRVDIALVRAARAGSQVSVVVFDGVRRIDDASDDFLAFVELLHRGVRSDDTVGQLSRRTFVIVLNDVADPDQPARIARRLLVQSGVQCRLGLAMGAAPLTADQLLTRAVREASAPLGLVR
jgi:GGDEF domain-containing protein